MSFETSNILLYNNLFSLSYLLFLALSQFFRCWYYSLLLSWINPDAFVKLQTILKIPPCFSHVAGELNFVLTLFPSTRAFPLSTLRDKIRLLVKYVHLLGKYDERAKTGEWPDGTARAEKSLTDRIKVAVPRGELAAWRDRKAKPSRVTERHLVFKEGTFNSLEGPFEDGTKSPCRMMVW